MSLVALHSVPVWLPPTENWIHVQLRHLPPDVEAHVICDRKREPERFPVERLHCFSDLPRWRAFVDLRRLRIELKPRKAFFLSVARGSGARLLHSHYGDTGWTNLAAAEEAGLAHVVTFYGHDVNRLPARRPVWRRRYRELFERVDAVLCEGPHMARCVAALGCPASKLRVHHLGVPLGELPFRPRALAAGEPLRVLMASAFREKKGLPDGVRAVGRLAKEGPVELTIVGDAGPAEREQEEKRRVLRALEEAGVRARLPGFLDREGLLREAYRHHVFLAPSAAASDGDTEGGAPVVLIEMAATGMPLVSTRHADIPELVLDGTTGLLAEERDPGGLAAKLRWLRDHPGAWAGLAERGRRRMEAEFDAAAQGRRLGALYDELLRSRGKG